ncbi:MAG TPA: hypothetical protein VF269_09630 [Rhodanobacteraceae bacterium]
MKTSLLAIGLMMGAGLIGTAHAANATTRATAPNIDNQSAATAMPASHGLLSALDSVLSGDAQTSNGTAQTHNPATHTRAGKSKPHPSLATASNPVLGQRHAATDSSADPSRPSASTASGQSADPAQNDLGWQSLLPGSIQ